MTIATYSSSEKRKHLRDKSNEFFETNDCSVKALALVTDSTYDVAHATLRAKGRKKGRGTNMGQWLPAVEDLGYHYVNVTGSFEGKTVNSIEAELPKGKKFYIIVRAHMAAFDGNEIVDWSQGRRHRVTHVYHVAKFKKDLMPECKYKPKVVYQGALDDIIFWYHLPEKGNYGEYRIYFRENGKVRWLNTKYSEWDAEDSAIAAARKRGWNVSFGGELDPNFVDED